MTIEIVPPHLAVQAMRDNGYKNAAYALAELMDNSIQAGATQVELLCGEREFIDQRRRMRIEQIAVLDNGCGMDAKIMEKALQFGNGTHLTADTQKGMGRFGMGLPSASISQCKRVDVWSWQNDVDSALHTYLDLDAITAQQQRSIPEPKLKEIPDVWRTVGKSWGKSGTLVVWSKIDRAMWRTAQAIITNSEFIIGRMYRKFIVENSVAIRLVQFNFDQPMPTAKEQWAMPNDPGYVMERTSCPAPFDQTPMFDLWDIEWQPEILFEGHRHTVRVRFSLAKKDARTASPTGEVAGRLPHGFHAAKNVGISLVRANRELELSQLWVLSDPRERWWGVEVEFPPALDKIFGVTNNKQTAHHFSDIGKLDLDAMLEEGQTITSLRDEMLNDDDPTGLIIEIAYQIRNDINKMRRRLQLMREDTRKIRHNPLPPPEVIATAATKVMQQEGLTGASDKDENLPPEERQRVIEETLISEGIDETQAHEFAARLISEDMKYGFETADLETSAFFSVKSKVGSLLVLINSNHPAYKHLIDVLDQDTAGTTVEALQKRLHRASDGLKLLLLAWARYEDKLDGRLREAAQDARTDWGRIARRFLSHDE